MNADPARAVNEWAHRQIVYADTAFRRSSSHLEIKWLWQPKMSRASCKRKRSRREETPARQWNSWNHRFKTTTRQFISISILSVERMLGNYLRVSRHVTDDVLPFLCHALRYTFRSSRFSLFSALYFGSDYYYSESDNEINHSSDLVCVWINLPRNIASYSTEHTNRTYIYNQQTDTLQLLAAAWKIIWAEAVDQKPPQWKTV